MVEYSQRWPPPVRRLTSLLWRKRGNTQPGGPNMIIRGTVFPGYEGAILEEMFSNYREYLDEVVAIPTSNRIYKDERWVSFPLSGRKGRGADRGLLVIREEGHFLFEFGKVTFVGSSWAFLTGALNFCPVRNGIWFYKTEPVAIPGEEFILPVEWEVVNLNPGEEMPDLPDYQVIIR